MNAPLTYTILFANMREEDVKNLHDALRTMPMNFAEPFVQVIRQQKAEQDAARAVANAAGSLPPIEVPAEAPKA